MKLISRTSYVAQPKFLAYQKGAKILSLLIDYLKNWFQHVLKTFQLENAHISIPYASKRPGTCNVRGGLDVEHLKCTPTHPGAASYECAAASNQDMQLKVKCISQSFSLTATC